MGASQTKDGVEGGSPWGGLHDGGGLPGGGKTDVWRRGEAVGTRNQAETHPRWRIWPAKMGNLELGCTGNGGLGGARISESPTALLYRRGVERGHGQDFTWSTTLEPIR